MASSDYISNLEQNYPRIISQLTMLWGHEGLRAYLSHLLIDDRGDRQGFTPTTMEEIMFLDSLHEDLLQPDLPPVGQKLWENPLTKSLKA
ncbi:MAG: hypothetical protein Q8O37_16105 [Sulfuricellaceae bacterium]|nr:hypothetical protein [Sulfuricellaceae bacterium]